MNVQRIAEGLWRWTIPLVEGGREAACVYYESDGGSGPTVLIDPAVPPEGHSDRDRFFRALDRDVARAGGPVVVLLTSPRHVRDTGRILARYAGRPGASAHGPAPRAAYPAGLDLGPVPDGGVPAPGVRCLTVAGPGDPSGPEVAWLLDGPPRTLVVGDRLAGAGGGRLVAGPIPAGPASGSPASGSPASSTDSWAAAAFDERAGPLAAVLPGHGEPVLEGGAAALRRALAGRTGPS